MPINRIRIAYMKKLLLILFFLGLFSPVFAGENDSLIQLKKKKEVILKYIVKRETIGYSFEPYTLYYLSKRFVLKNNSGDKVRIISYNLENEANTNKKFYELSNNTIDCFSESLFILFFCPPLGIISLADNVIKLPFRLTTSTKHYIDYKKHFKKITEKEIKPGKTFKFNSLQSCECTSFQGKKWNINSPKTKNIECKEPAPIIIQVANIRTGEIYNIVEPTTKLERSEIVREINSIKN